MNLPGSLAKKASYKGSGSLGGFSPEWAEFSEVLPAELGKCTNLSAGFQRNLGEKAERGTGEIIELSERKTVINPGEEIYSQCLAV